MTTDGEKLVVNVEAAAKLLNISRPSAYAAIERNEIPHLRIGGRILVPVAALKKLLESVNVSGKV